MRTQTFRTLLIAVALTLVFAACESAGDDGGTTTGGDEGTATTADPSGGENESEGEDQGEAETDSTLRVALPIDPRTLTPWTSVAQEMNVTWQIFERLVAFDEEAGEYVPALAESLTWVDEVTLDIALRDGLVFSNGEPLDMDAVVFSMEQVLDPEVGGVELARRTANIDSFEAVDDSTLRINFQRAIARDLNLADLSWSTYVVPPEYFQEVGYDAFSASPIGSGPFVFVDRVTDSTITLEKNPNYAGHSGVAPDFDRLEYRVLPEPGARVAALEAGDVDLVVALPIEAVESLEAADGFEVVSIPGERIQELQVDMLYGMSEASAKTEVRQALLYALDRQLIIDTVLLGQGTPVNQLATPTWSGYVESLPPLEYDPDRVQELLTAAGYPDGLELPLYCPSGAYPKDRELCDVITSELAKVGITAPITVLEGGAYFEAILAHEAGPLLYIGRLPPSRAAVDMMNSSLCDSADSYKCDPVLDEMAAEARAQTNPEDYLEATEELVRYDLADPARIPLWTVNDVYGLSADVEGWQPQSNQVLRFWGVSISS